MQGPQKGSFMEHGEMKTIPFKLFRNLPQDSKTAAHSVVAIVVLACWVLPLKLH